MKEIKFTDKEIPETLAEMPKKIKTDLLVHLNIMMKPSLVKKLADKSIESGYPKQEIIDMALEAFLKDEK